MSFLRVHKSSVKTITLIDGDTREKRKVRVRANYPDQSFVEYLVALYHKQPDCIVLADGAALPPKPSLLFPRIHSGDKCVLLFVSGTRADVRNKWEVRLSLTHLRETGSQNNASAAAAATTGSSKPTSQATPNAAVSPTATSNQAQEQVPQLTRSLSAAFDDVPPEWRTLLLEAGIYPSDMSSESRCNAISAAVASAIRSAITEKMKQGTVQASDMEAFYQLAELPAVSGTTGRNRKRTIRAANADSAAAGGAGGGAKLASGDASVSVSALARMVSSLTLGPAELASVSQQLNKQQTQWESFYRRFERPKAAATAAAPTVAATSEPATSPIDTRPTVAAATAAAAAASLAQLQDDEDDEEENSAQPDDEQQLHPACREVAEMSDWLEMSINRQMWPHLGRFWLALRDRLRALRAMRDTLVAVGQSEQLSSIEARAKSLIQRCEREYAEHLPCSLDEPDDEFDDNDDDVYFEEEDDDDDGGIFY